MLEIELISIGDEVLSGFTVNTNAAFIGQQLLSQGYHVRRQQTLPDNEEMLREGFSTALKRSRIVISTGGLGPTIDDITRQVAAQIYDSGFRLDVQLAKDLEMRYGNKLESLQDQATVPEKATILPNPLGTAPGLIFENDQATLILLPGIPEEMKRLVSEYVIPYLVKNFPVKEKINRKIIQLFELSESAVDPSLREFKTKYPDVNFGIYPNAGDLTIHLSSYSEIDQIYQDIKNRFANNYYESVSGTIEEAVQALFIEKKLTLSMAESCTGGTASARLTAIPGASEYFIGSIVCYSNELKRKLLNVPEDILSKYGAVSEETATCLSEGVLKLTGSDFSLAVTGVAGPSGGSNQKPVGTIWMAISQKGKQTYTWKLNAKGNRLMIINRSVNSMFSHLLMKGREA